MQQRHPECEPVRQPPAMRHGITACCSLLLLVAGLFAGAASQAEEVTWLYQVDVPVASQSASDRSDAAGLALTEVLQRTSGQAVLPDSTRLRVAVDQPERYYSQFIYVRNARDGALQLRVNFSPEAITRLSRNLELPVWWSNRPRILLWALAPDGQVVPDPGAQPNLDQTPGAAATSLNSADSALEFSLALQQRARQRGVPLVLPQADETGVVEVSETAVRSGDLVSLAAYSASYEPEIVAAGALRGGAGDFSARFVLEVEGTSSNLTARAPSLSQLGAAVADRLTNMLAERYAVTGQIGEVSVAISGVNSPRDYADLLRYLNSLAFVDTAQLRELTGGELRVALVTGASRSKLLQLLAVDGLLAPQDAAATQLSQRNPPVGGFDRPAIALVWLGSASS